MPTGCLISYRAQRGLSRRWTDAGASRANPIAPQRDRDVAGGLSGRLALCVTALHKTAYVGTERSSALPRQLRQNSEGHLTCRKVVGLSSLFTNPRSSVLNTRTRLRGCVVPV